jgi:hypothetical protein
MINEHFEYRTKVGSHLVRFYNMECGSQFPIHGAVRFEGLWTPMRWTNSGKSEEGKEFDLVKVKYAPKREKAIIILNSYPAPLPQRILARFNGKRVRVTLEEC